jgi:ketosteroid isomerase-like protein
VGFFQAMGERSAGTFRLDVHEILSNGGDVVAALVTELGERNGKTMSDPSVHLWTFVDGEAASFQCFAGAEQEQDTFWA